MKRIASSLVALTFLSLGCAARLPARADSPSATAAARTEVSEHATDAASLDDAVVASAGTGRQVGDFIVYRFSGSFQKTPVTLSQRVVERNRDAVVVEMTLSKKGGPKETLRVEMSDAAQSRGEVIAVKRVENDEARDATVEDYDRLIAQVTLAADQNEELLGVETTNVEVGTLSLPCRRVSYRVKIGKKEATLRTLESDSFAWGDLGGEITAKDGRVLYRAEVVEMGRTAGETIQPLARTSDE